MTDDAPQTPDTPPPAADPQSIEGLFLQALGQSPEQRQAFLDEACGDDAERRRRIEALLRAYEDAGSFLEKPPAGVDSAATLSIDFLMPSDDPGLLGMLGPYEVYEMLGRGGMGIVFRARDPKLNRVVAIKVLAPELAANPNARRRFLREAQAAAAISHPHVVTIHAVDEGSTADGGNPASSGSRVSSLPFIVMECIVGQTLQQKLDKQGSLRLTEILRIGHQTAQGLAAAHRQGLIHRDIKPANILLENGIERVKITDFGLARAADDVSITRTGEVSGTPQYMSPEQASGGTIDHRSDLFSLGCVLYAMCTGRSPFRATTLAAAIRRVCDDTPRPIEEINPEAPHWLIDIVNRLLAKDPDDRIQSADEVAELLGDHLAGIQHPPRVRTTEPARPRTVAAVPQPAANANAARGLGMNVPLRVLLWLGAIALLIPVFFAVGGTAIGAGGDALEGAVIAAMICWPIALITFAVALLDRSVQGHPYANALFLLFCILLGPIGILLYLVRRDQYLMSDRPAAETAPPQQVASQHSQDKGESREIPQWLLTPLPGPVKILAFLLFAAACLVLGQAIEQWSDVSQEVGICLYAAAIPLAVLAIQCALGAGFQFRWPQVAALGLLGIVLAYFGAQAPDREFKYGLRAEPETAALFTAGLYLVAIPISLLLWGLSQAGEKGRARRDLLGTALIWIGATIWGALAAWLLLVGVGAVPPPPFDARSSIEAPVMFAVMLGGLFFGAGMILRSYVVTPGLVRRVAAGAEQGASDAGAVSTPAASTAGTSPWRVLGWMIIAGLVLVPGCLVVWLGLPYLALERSDIGIVQIEFDSARPISWVAALGGVGAARSEQRAIEEPVTSNPYRLALPEGVYDLTMTWQAEGRTGTFAQRVKVEAGKTERLNVRQNIAMALQPQLDQRPREEEDGYPPPRTIPLVEEGQPAGDLPGMAGAMPGGEFGEFESSPAVAEGAVLLTIIDPGLTVVFDPVEDEEDVDPDFGGKSMGESDMSGGMMGGFGGMMPGGMGGWMGATSSGTIKLPEGTYRVLVTDQLAGWGRAPSSRRFGGTFSAGSPEAQLPASELPERLQVVAGEFRKLTVSRDLKRVADLQPDWQQRGFFAFRWNGETYDLTRTQAVVVQRLLEAGLTDASAIHEALLLAPAEMSAETRKLEPVTLSLEEAQQRLEESEQQTLAALFNDGQHPAWGTLIVEGDEPASYRLAELQTRDPAAPEMPQVNVDVTIADAGLRVSFEQLTTDARRTIPRGKVLNRSGTISVTPGTYQIIVEDELAGWMTKTEEGEPGLVRYPPDKLIVWPINLPTAVEVSRNFHKMAASFPREINRGTHFFRWQGETYKFNGDQAPIVAFLLKAYADGEPDLHEARLLRGGTFRGNEIDLPPLTSTQADELLATFRDEGHSLKALFDAGEHPAWGTLIIEGEEPNTYRLAELHPDMLSSANDRAQVNVTFEDPGLRAEFFRFKDGTRNAVRTGVSAAEDTTLFLQPGRYRVHVKDDLVGWRILTQEGTTEPHSFSYTHITVSAEQSTDLVIARDLQTRVRYYGNPNLETGGKSFRWNAETFELSQEQAIAVLRLLKAYTRDTRDARGPDVHEGELLRPAKLVSNYLADFPMTPREADEYLQRMTAEGRSLKGLFDDGAHPAWGTLIVAGEKPNTYRLAELTVEPAAEGASMPSAEADVAGLAITVEDAELIARIFSADTDEPRQPLHEITDSAIVTLPVGRYDVWVEDRVAGWHRLSSEGEPGPVQYKYDRLRVTPDERTASADSGRRHLLAGETTSLKVSRNLHNVAAGLVPQYGRPQKFRWQEQSYDLTEKQWPVVAILLKAYADGEPDVHEAQLLSGASFRGAVLTLNPLIRTDPDEALAALRERGQSLKSRFDDGEHPGWGTLIVEGAKPNTYRLAELQVPGVEPPAEPGDLGAGREEGSAPAAGVGALAADLQGRSGQLTIDIRDDGFLVAVRRRSAFDGIVAGSEQQVTDVGVTYLRVAPGEYEVLIRDQLFGWAEDRTQTVTVGTSDPPFLTIDRDLAEYAEGRPGTSTFRWDGRAYTLRYLAGPSAIASRLAINRLLAAYAQGSFDVADEKLLSAWKEDDPELYRNLPGREPQTLEELFLTEGAEENDKHPWGRLIVPGETEGTYRLAPLDRGTIEVTEFSPGMVVTVARLEPDPRFSRREVFTDRKLDVPPGEYHYVVGDDFVGWGRWQPNASSPGFGPNENPVRSGTIAVASGESISITADRRWADYIEPPEPTESSRWIPFMWFPKYEPQHTRPHVWGVRVSTGSPDNGIDNFDVPQFRVLRELLRAFADGQPEVAEDELLRRAGVEAESWADVFPADGRGYGGRWQTIIVAGKTEGTWRLKPPPSEAEQ